MFRIFVTVTGFWGYRIHIILQSCYASLYAYASEKYTKKKKVLALKKKIEIVLPPPFEIGFII